MPKMIPCGLLFVTQHADSHTCSRVGVGSQEDLGSPLKTFLGSPLKTFLWSPLKTILGSPLKTFLGSPLKTFSGSPLKTFWRPPSKHFWGAPSKPFLAEYKNLPGLHFEKTTADQVVPVVSIIWMRLKAGKMRNSTKEIFNIL